jgi:VWFA-related protein
VRQAAEKHIAGLQPTDRVAIFTTSGRNMLDFTADRQKLKDALMRLAVNPISGDTSRQCPYVTYYMADMIVNKNDPVALQAAIATSLACVSLPDDPSAAQEAQAFAKSAAQRELELGDQETRVTLMTMEDVVRRIGRMPGPRSIVLVSPGFYNPDDLQRQTELSDKALRSNVVINTLDARGLYTSPSKLFSDETTVDMSSNTPADTQALIQKTQITDQNALVDGMVLGELADATGGTWFHNNNDFDEGLRLLSSPPSYSYLLGFSPQQLKPDGKFHTLKVTVKNPEKLAIQARKGYFAPNHQPDAADQAKQDIEDAVFSQEELHGLPVELHTQFFKQSDTAAQIAVLAHVKLRGIHFTKVAGRNRSDLTIVSALFDTNGNYVKGSEKVLEMRLRDQTLERRLDSGVTLKSNFDVKPGSYLVRLVVRDAEGQIAAENGAVEIPY